MADGTAHYAEKVGDTQRIYIYIYNFNSLGFMAYVVLSISFKTFLYRHFKLSETLENSVCYSYTSYEMTDQFL